MIPVRDDWEPLQCLLTELMAVEAEKVVVAVGDPPPAFRAQWTPEVRFLVAARIGRGQQLAQGIAATDRDWLWLLHADTGVDEACCRSFEHWRAERETGWGRFDVQLVGQHPLLGMVGWFMNRRSRLSGICTGDQGMFVHRTLLDAVGGMPCQSLMEDIELSKRLRRHCRPGCLAGPLRTSGRRWDQRGLFRTILLMWRFRLRYWLGADPEKLADDYYRRHRRSTDGASHDLGSS